MTNLSTGNVTLDDCDIAEDHWGHLWYQGTDKVGTSRWCNGRGVLIGAQAHVCGPQDTLVVMLPPRTTPEVVHRAVEQLIPLFGKRVLVVAADAIAVLKGES